MTIWVLHTTSSYDGSERRDSWDTLEDAEAAIAKVRSIHCEYLALYAWTGPTVAACTCCGQVVELSLGEWRNPFGVPRCPEVTEYPWRHVPAGMQQVPDADILPAWWDDPAGWRPS